MFSYGNLASDPRNVSEEPPRRRGCYVNIIHVMFTGLGNCRRLPLPLPAAAAAARCKTSNFRRRRWRSNSRIRGRRIRVVVVGVGRE